MSYRKKQHSLTSMSPILGVFGLPATAPRAVDAHPSSEDEGATVDRPLFSTMQPLLPAIIDTD